MRKDGCPGDLSWAEFPGQLGKVSSLVCEDLVTMLETSARPLRVLSLLQARRNCAGPELAQRLGVTTRTVRNDIDRLRRLGYPVDGTPGAAGGYRLGTGASVPPLLLGDDEAVAIALSLRAAAGGSGAGTEDAALQVLAKLQQLLPSRLRHRVSALAAFTDTLPAAGPVADPETFAVLAAACRDQERVLFDYRRHEGSQGRRDVEPHRLVNLGRRWYLVAWDTGPKAWRTFRADRITLPKNHCGPRFAPRQLPDADVAGFVARSTSSAMWRYRATVTVQATYETLVARLPSSVAVEALDQKTCRVHAGSDTAEMLACYLGLLGADFTVDEPDEHPELMMDLAQRYRRAAGR